MTIGTSNTTSLSFIKEVTPGVTPATPAMQLLRFTGESLEAANSTTVSDEIRNDRATADLILTDQSNKGDIMGEFSATTYDKLLEAALWSDATWTTLNLTGITFAATASGFTDSGNGFLSAGIQAGQYIRAAGFTNPANNRIYRVLTVVAGTITTEPAPAATQTAGTTKTFTGSTIKSGVTDTAFTIQKKHSGIGTVSYQNFRGSRVATMTQELSVGAIAKMKFGMTCLTSEVTETQISGLTEVARTTTPVMNCVGDVTAITADSDDLTTALKFTELSLSYDNKVRELKAIGTLGSVDVRPGTIEAKATINPYFENIELLEAFLANASFHLSWQMTDSTGYSYVFSLPNVKFVSQSLAAGSKDQDMIIKGDVQAILDPVSLTTMRIDRIAA